ncbi:MAG: heavy-metal-associated domain-containing protein [Hyphomonadaceae bacterium]|nr:heavy-metal-associated domain-containing protein [Hyphomonadaceae bacterium]
MTVFKSLAVALALAAISPALAQAQPNRQQAQKTAPIAADALVSVNGLVCDFCAQAIEKSFRRRAEINDVRVDLTAKLVSIDFKPNTTLDDATIRQIITNAGYTVTNVRRPTATP